MNDQVKPPPPSPIDHGNPVFDPPGERAPGEVEIPHEWWRYLGDQRLCRVATADADGKPHVTPTWYVVYRERIYLGTQKTRKKLRNLRENNRVSFVVDSGTSEAEYKGIKIDGHVQFLDAPDFHDLYRVLLLQRYYGTEHNPGFGFVRSLPAPQLMRVVPESFYTWDYARFA